MKLSECQIRELVWIFYMSCLGGHCAERTHQSTLKALMSRELVRYHPADYTRVTTTPAGAKIVLTQYHQAVIDLSVKTFGWSIPPIVVEEVLARTSPANLPMYIVHEDPRVRELARRVMEARGGTNG